MNTSFSYLARFLLIGILFGIVMTKSEAVSWFRIQEMFHFDSFHMYGIIGTAVVLGAIGIFAIKAVGLKTIDGNDLELTPKKMEFPRLILGGTLFGVGWAFTGACPGPLYTLLGHGIGVVIVIILSALVGAAAYGAVRNKLPH